jgi:hypothetical protein
MHRSRSRRTLTQAAATAGLLTLVGAGFAPAAFADEEPPGNRGTVKVHETGTPDDDRRNEPKLCDFRIVGFGFPEDADLEVHIEGHGGPNAGPDTFDTTVPNSALSDEGDFAIDGPTLADGMYKLYVENTTAPGGPKQKVFKIDCPDQTEAAGAASVDDGQTAVLGGSATRSGAVAPATGVPAGTATGSAATTVAAEPVTEVLGATLERPALLPAGTAVTAGGTTVLPATQVAGAQVSRAALARTGLEALLLVALGVGLLGAGTAVLRGRRRLTA